LKNSKITTLNQENLPDLPYINTIIFDDSKNISSIKIFDALIIYEDSLNNISSLGTTLADEQGDTLKKEILKKLPRLKSINEEPVEEEEV